MASRARLTALGPLLSLSLLAPALIAFAPACSSDDETKQPVKGETCPLPTDTFEAGDPTGHPDPYGAKAAGQARAGRLTSADMIVQPAHGRQRVNVGDFVLANEKVAVTIEDKGLSDGYARFGGEILAVDRVGDDGKPLGTSYYGETLMALSIEMIDVDSVTVVNDGSDGKAAIVRASGQLKPIPFLDGALAQLFPRRYGVQAAYDYVLEPGAEKVQIRIGIKNPAEEPIEFAFDAVSDEMHGFFHSSRNTFVTEDFGFGKASGKLSWAGFVNDGTSFAWRPSGGETLELGLEVSGFIYTLGPGFVADGCKTTWTDHADVIAGGPDLDGLREAVRRVDGAPAWRAVTGTVKDASGAGVAGAGVYLRDGSGKLLSRTKSDPTGTFTIHAPPDEATTLTAWATGFGLSADASIDAAASTADLAFAPSGKIDVVASDSASAGALPVRVQVVPSAGVIAPPEAFGIELEKNGRAHQEFAVSGKATLDVPAGDHRVIVSRGYEYEIFDQTVTVAAGQTTSVPVTLERSVDSIGWMGADFHIHSWFSADSNDAVDRKVTSAIADGLEIPVSSEHEWVIDFQPIVEKLNMTSWAFGMPSEELTTFTWGHFGVVPLFPKPDQVNNGAVEWIGRMPPEMFDDVQSRPEDPFFIVNHPSGSDFGAYFGQSGLDATTGVGKKKDLWSTNFDGVEVFNDSDFEANRKGSVRDWFALLNAGHTVYAVGSSDSHHIRSSPVGYPRTMLFFGHDDPKQLTANLVRDALAAGTSTISGGLFMTVAGPAGEKPGATIKGGSADVQFTITTQAPSWVDATELEVIVDGVTQLTEPLAPLGTGTGKTFVNQVTVSFDATKTRSWVVFHAKGEQDLAPLHPGRRPFAASNPVFWEP